MQAVYAKDIEQIKEFLEDVAADMEIINSNIRELDCSEAQKVQNIKLITELRKNIYNTAKQLK